MEWYVVLRLVLLVSYHLQGGTLLVINGDKTPINGRK